MSRSLFILSFLTVLTVACSHQSMMQPSTAAPASTAITGLAAADAHSTNGVAGSMPAYYDDELFTINLKDQPANAEISLIAHNGSINTIYMSDGCHPGGHDFVSVLDAIQGDGFNPLWREVQIHFASPAGCKQFTSDTEILAAAAAHTITLETTDELYRCSVIGKK